MPGETILVVDDERDLVELIRFNLERAHYKIVTAYDGDAALAAARRERPDLILLDLMLPKVSGQDVAVQLKANARTKSIPIIMLTARSDESDIIVGLQLGADDYVTKPFSVKVLLARVAAVLRRKAAGPQEDDVLRAGPLMIDRGRHCVQVDGAAVPVTLTEYKVLEALMAARSRVLTRDDLIDRVMGPDIAITDRTIDVHVTALRRKLGDHRNLVETVRGVGYRIADMIGGTPAP